MAMNFAEVLFAYVNVSRSACPSCPLARALANSAEFIDLLIRIVVSFHFHYKVYFLGRYWRAGVQVVRVSDVRQYHQLMFTWRLAGASLFRAFWAVWVAITSSAPKSLMCSDMWPSYPPVFRAFARSDAA